MRGAALALLVLVGVGAGVGALLWSAPARACATCGCGDPTLTAMGAEKPFQNRIRAALELRYRTDAIGQPDVDQIRLREYRLDAQLAWAPFDRLFLGVTVPGLRRTIEYVNLAEKTTWGLGDIELRAKVFVFQDRDFAPRHLVGLVGGVKLPTAPLDRDAKGDLLPIELQPGTGSFDPIAGISYAYFPRPWSFYASVQGAYPTRGTNDFRASPSLRTTTTAQYQFFPALAVRLGVDTRLDGKAIENGGPERDSGGFIGFVSPEVLVSPVTDLLLFASTRIPVVNRLSGYHDEGPFIGGGVAIDF